jgi:hypothetical protein
MPTGACASTLPEAAHAGTQALLAEPGEAAGTAVDAVIAGVLAIAARNPAVLLGACAVLVGGMGEGRLVVDGRARQPGLGAPRPRGFVEGAIIPDAARIAAPGLPAALVLAHAGRGERTLNELSRVALASAGTLGAVDPKRVESIRAFGREGAGFIRGGAVRAALLAATARSVGGTLTEDDLAAVRPDIVPARTLEISARTWSLVPFERAFDEGSAEEDSEPVAIVAAVDARGAMAIASVSLARASLSLDAVGLAAPLVARPVMRGVTREKAGSPLPLVAPVGISRDLALGLGGEAAAARAFPLLLSYVSDETSVLDDALAKQRATGPHGAEGLACGVLFGASRDGRAIKDRRI